MLCFVGCVLVVGVVPSTAAPQRPDAIITNAAMPGPVPPGDGVRPEDVMIGSDVVGDVWDTTSPADAMGITPKDADILPALTSGVSSVQMLEEKKLLRPPRPEPTTPKRLPTERWRPAIPIQTLFYLSLAIVVVVVLLLKARG